MRTRTGEVDADTEATVALTLGIGCRRGVSVGQIESAVQAALGTLDACALPAVRCVATIEDKADEASLIAFCAQHQLPLVTFTRDEIANAFRRDPTLAHSSAAQTQLQIDGVCEPCALLALKGGTLVVRKIALNGVTVAIATATGIAATPNNTNKRTR